MSKWTICYETDIAWQADEKRRSDRCGKARLAAPTDSGWTIRICRDWPCYGPYGVWQTVRTRTIFSGAPLDYLLLYKTELTQCSIWVYVYCVLRLVLRLIQFELEAESQYRMKGCCTPLCLFNAVQSALVFSIPNWRKLMLVVLGYISRTESSTANTFLRITITSGYHFLAILMFAALLNMLSSNGA